MIPFPYQAAGAGMVQQQIGGGSGSLYSEVMADSPWMYLRLGESSGSTATNEVGGTNGVYQGSYTLGNAALYSGGPTCYGPSSTTGRVTLAPAAIPTLNEMTIACIVKFPSLSGIHQIIVRDRNTMSTGNRYFQWRINGSNMEFVKITGGTATVSAAHGMTAGVACMLHVRVTSAGAVTMFRNGVAISAGLSVAAANYGSSDAAEMTISNRGASSEAVSGDQYSEAACFASALSDARILAHAQAAGF